MKSDRLKFISLPFFVDVYQIHEFHDKRFFLRSLNGGKNSTNDKDTSNDD